MTIFKFSNNGNDYGKRAKSSLTTNLAVSIAIGLIVSATSDIGWGFGIALFVFLVQYFKSDRWDKTFVNSISIDNQNVTVDYYDRNTKKTLSGHLNNFIFKKKISALNRTRTPYLTIYQNKDLQIKQFVIGDWTEDKMTEVVNAFKNAVSVTADT